MAYTAPIAGDASTSTAAVVDANFKETMQGLYVYAADAVGTDAYAITLSPAIAAYTAGLCIRMKAATANTGPATINVNAVGVKSIRKNGIAELDNGDIKAGQIVTLVYDGTYFQLQTAPASISMRGFQMGWAYQVTGTSDYGNNCIAGFSDVTDPSITLVTHGGAGNSVLACRAKIATDVGYEVYPMTITEQSANANTPGVYGAVYIGSDLFESTEAGTIKKNNSAVSFSGTARNGPLGHNDTSNYLLVLYSTTKIARFSGIAGTTLTNVGDITLDTAVTQTAGFLYDKANARYICVDTTANVIRRFDSSGVTIDTVAYTFDDTKLAGLAAIGGRVYAVLITGGGNSSSANDNASGHATFIPTGMTL